MCLVALNIKFYLCIILKNECNVKNYFFLSYVFCNFLGPDSNNGAKISTGSSFPFTLILSSLVHLIVQPCSCKCLSVKSENKITEQPIVVILQDGSSSIQQNIFTQLNDLSKKLS